MIRAEFARRVAADFGMTGGIDEATMFCGIGIRRDWKAQTVTMHQGDFAKEMVKKYSLAEEKEETMPYKVSHARLVPWGGEATPRSQFDCVVFVGDLIWYSRTNPDLAWRASNLARFMQCPGPQHVAAAKHVLRSIRRNMGQGITYHGSDAVLMQSYDHRNKIIMCTDANFDHTGENASVTGVAAMMNGGVIAYRSRGQTTKSNTTTEAETKAIAVAVAMASALTDLHGEFTHVEHGPVRLMTDSAGAVSVITRGLDTKTCASYKRAQHMAEEAVEQGKVWLGLIPGGDNPADILTKQVGNIGDFHNKGGIISGKLPYLYESKDVTKLLARSHVVSR